MKHLVIIGQVIPEPASTAAGKRMMQLITAFQDEVYKITFLTTAQNIEFSERIDYQHIQLNDPEFKAIIKNLNPDVVLFDRFVTEEQFGWQVAECCPPALRILDTEDLHFLRKAREKTYKQRNSIQESDLINDTFKREMASILRCDLSLIISEYEMTLLTDRFNIDKNILHYLPLFAEENPGLAPFSKRKNFISIGNFLHEPNWQTVLKLKSIWKSIHEHLPDVEMHIYGAYAGDKVIQLHNEKEKFLVKGRAVKVEEVFNTARVMLAPIPFGAGIKGKLLESMAYGLPNITTPTGAEGMHGDLPWNGFITTTDAEFVKQAVLLYKNESIWQQARDQGFRIIEQRFSKAQFLPALFNRINEISDALAQHRQKNFLGEILQHHTLQSTKYLSKWIQEKNK